MKERPILMSAPMVLATLDGSKTQTRRIAKISDPAVYPGTDQWQYVTAGGQSFWWNCQPEHPHHINNACPYGQPGDRLYVRETWQHSNAPYGPYDLDCDVFYRADYMNEPHGPDGELSPEGRYRSWQPSIHMPRVASRILLEIVSVHVERLQDISELDAIAEGVCRSNDRKSANSAYVADAQLAYRLLWESINGPGSWDTNPWVWVIDFKRENPSK